MSHQYQDLISIFNHCFLSTHNTELVRGGHEPIYLPANAEQPQHQIIFAHGYFASGLHEIAHWLVAGESRRLLEDFGYWYCPDGRDKKTQLSFEQVEVKPQAIEWALAVACDFKFNVSSDNLNGWQSDRVAFQEQVHTKVLQLMSEGFNQRTQLLLTALGQFFQTVPLTGEHFDYPQMKPQLQEIL
jgi:elongation factor P hydroxylase